ncbi:MAG: 50S ribosomal protein L25 [Verrucomicrobia bacterium]|nr:50S ribosomal protein L25 [Verrucomicrobiota bacterium]
MKSVPLTAYPRTATRRAGAKKLRETGRVPAVIYGRTITPQNLEIKSKDLEDLVHHAASENILLNLTVESDQRPTRLALVQEIQHHPLSGKPLHIDLHEIKEDEKVTVQVPVEAIGEAAGVKAGGILEHVLFKLKVRCLPKDLPATINVDVSHLEIGKAVHIGEVTPPPGCQILGDKHISVLAVAAPITEEQEAALVAAATETTAADVEMIKEKKEEGEEGAAPAKPGEKAPAKGAAAPVKGAAPAKPGEKAPAAAAAAPAAEKKPAGKK